jgi:hypothetical protein
MPEWRHTLELTDVWSEEMDLTAKRDVIVERITKLPPYRQDIVLQDIVDDLRLVETEDDFNDVWDYFYDWADSKRVWVNLWAPAR